MVVSVRQFTKLLGKSMFTGIVNPGITPTIPSPITERIDQTIKLRMIRAYCPTLSQRYMMWGIKAVGRQISYRTCLMPFTVIKICCTKRIAVIFDQPELISVTKFSYVRSKGLPNVWAINTAFVLSVLASSSLETSILYCGIVTSIKTGTAPY